MVRPAGGSFLVEENPFSASLIAETQRLDMQAKAPESVTTGSADGFAGGID